MRGSIEFDGFNRSEIGGIRRDNVHAEWNPHPTHGARVALDGILGGNSQARAEATEVSGLRIHANVAGMDLSSLLFDSLFLECDRTLWQHRLVDASVASGSPGLGEPMPVPGCRG